MPDAAAPAPAGAGGGDAGPDTEFAELRSLLVGPERQALDAIEARLNDPGRVARDVSDVLPEAVRLRKHDPHLTRALAPTIEEAITASVRRNPRPLADALFPVIGPAIRKAIAASLSGMLESLNRTLEHSLSWRAIQWRITALRTGKSFAEVVLLNTLVYRVEQVFLIDRETGLLLQHVSDGGRADQDVDMVSGMLTAIRDFARDSFRVSDDAGLETLQVGELSVWIEQGPHAVLAAVIRGAAPPEFRVALQETLEYTHAYHGEALRAFNGDATPLEAVRPALENLLRVQYRGEREARSHRLLWACAGVVAVLLAAWLVITLQARARWNGYLDALRAEPGIVVVSTGRSDGRYAVRGLRDPLARDPASLLAAHQLSPQDVSGGWQLYQALEPDLVVRRARAVLRPPAGTTLAMTDGVLSAEGAPPAAWVLESARVAPAIGGVLRYDAARSARAALDVLGRELAAGPVLFVRGQATLAPGEDAVLAAHVERARTVDALAALIGVPATLEISGHADSDGPPEANDSLSARRAESVRAALERQPLASTTIVTRAAGSREPLAESGLETDKHRNRRVSLRLAPVPAGK